MAWSFMLFAVIIFLSGLRDRQQVDAGLLKTDYPAVLPQAKLSALHFSMPPVSGEEYIYLWVDRSYLRNVQIGQIIPAPDDISLGLKYMVYRFRVSPGIPHSWYSFYIRPLKPGKLEGSVKNSRGESCTLSQLVQ